MVNCFPLCSGGAKDLNWFNKLRVRGRPFVREWAADLIWTCQSILAGFVEADRESLGSTPDFLFDLLSFAAGFNTGVKVVALYYVGSEMVGPTDQLITNAQAVLMKLSEGHHHAAGRCSKLFDVFMSGWTDAHRAQFMRMRGEQLQNQAQRQAEQQAHTHQQQYMSEARLLFPWPTYTDAGNTWGISSFEDNQYWASFFGTYRDTA
jgi:hypothetical protein